MWCALPLLFSLSWVLVKKNLAQYRRLNPERFPWLATSQSARLLLHSGEVKIIQGWSHGKITWQLISVRRNNLRWTTTGLRQTSTVRWLTHPSPPLWDRKRSVSVCIGSSPWQRDELFPTTCSSSDAPMLQFYARFFFWSPGSAFPGRCPS